MDFSVFDNRGPAEAGQRLELRDPLNGEIIMSGDNVCAVIVRGMTSRSVQADLRKRKKARMAAAKDKIDEAQVTEDGHNDLCDGAAPLIVGFEHVERDGRPLTTSAEDIRWFLDLTFPVMVIKKDERGHNALNAAGEIQVEMKNNPFAKQINDFSAEQALQAGNGQKA